MKTAPGGPLPADNRRNHAFVHRFLDFFRGKDDNRIYVSVWRDSMRRIVFRTALVLCCMFLFAVQASAAGADFQQRAGSMAEITGVRVSTDTRRH